MAMVEFDTDQMASLAAAMKQSSDSLSGRAGQLGRDAMGLRRLWTGAAASAYQVRQSQWSMAMGPTARLLGGAAEALSECVDRVLENEEQLAAAWLRL